MFKHPDFFYHVRIQNSEIVSGIGLGVKLAVHIKKLVRRYLKVQEPEGEAETLSLGTGGRGAVVLRFKLLLARTPESGSAEISERL